MKQIQLAEQKEGIAEDIIESELSDEDELISVANKVVITKVPRTQMPQSKKLMPIHRSVKSFAKPKNEAPVQ